MRNYKAPRFDVGLGSILNFTACRPICNKCVLDTNLYF